MRVEIIFGLALAALAIFLSLFLFPIVDEVTEGVDTTGWPSFLIAYKDILFIVFGILAFFAAMSIFFARKD